MFSKNHLVICLIATVFLLDFASLASVEVKDEISISASSNTISLQNDRCSAENFEKMDATVARIMAFGPHGRPFPLDQNQLNQFCM